MITICIATRNTHKVEEIRAILGNGFRCVTLADFPASPAVVEDAPTFLGNALKKAVTLAHWLTDTSAQAADFVLADDSGLEVDALDGAPGVHSARFSSLGEQQPGNAPDADNNAKLLRLLRGVPFDNRTARFRCVIALAPVRRAHPFGASPVCYLDPAEFESEIFEGACEGRILEKPRGVAGFGYDPLFLPNGEQATFAELGDGVKNRISHRAKALQKLKARFSSGGAIAP